MSNWGTATLTREHRVNETLERLERFVTDYEQQMNRLPAALEMFGFPTPPDAVPSVLDEAEAVEALIPCMRASAQETVAALARRKIGLVRLP